VTRQKAAIDELSTVGEGLTIHMVRSNSLLGEVLYILATILPFSMAAFSREFDRLTLGGGLNIFP